MAIAPCSPTGYVWSDGRSPVTLFQAEYSRSSQSKIVQKSHMFLAIPAPQAHLLPSCVTAFLELHTDIHRVGSPGIYAAVKCNTASPHFSFLSQNFPNALSTAGLREL